MAYHKILNIIIPCATQYMTLLFITPSLSLPHRPPLGNQFVLCVCKSVSVS